MAKVDYNTKEHSVGGSFETLPKGRYLALVGDSELKSTNDRTGKYYAFEFDAIKGPVECKGRKLWANFNIHNRSEVAQRIGREQFNGLCHAVGVPDPDDTVRLHNKLVVLIVDIEPGGDKPGGGKYRDKNIITGFLKASEADTKGVSTERPAKPEPAPRREAQKPAGKFDDLEDDIPF